MKNKYLSSLISLFMIIAIISALFVVTATARDIVTDDNAEKKIYADVNKEDDFSDSTVLVVMSHEASMNLKEYSTGDFGEENIKSIIDLSDATREKAFDQLEKLNHAFMNRTAIDTEDFKSFKNYKQVICLELKEKGKNKVIEAIEELQKRDDVIYAGPDYPIYGCSSDEDIDTLTPGDICYNMQKDYFELMQLPEAWAISTGSTSVTVGVIDSGIDGDHLDLSEVIYDEWSLDLTNGTYEELNEVVDVNGHGTHVAGIIGAKGDNIIWSTGVCWNVTLVSLRVFDENLYGYARHLAMAINHAEARGIPILNFSGRWGEYQETFDTHYNYPIERTLANYSGLFVCAAGNEIRDNDSNEIYPANFNLPNVITVGASDRNDNHWYSTYIDEDGIEREQGSNYGVNNVDLFAPGDSVWSLCAQDNQIIQKSGTSMAAPFVAGVAALMLANNPNLEPYEIKCIIMRSVDCGDPDCVDCSCDYGSWCNSCDGAFLESCVSGGRLNAYKALTGTVNHSYTFVNNGTSESLVCDYCKYSHESLTYISISVISGHRVTCSDCGYSFTQAHEWINRAGTYCCLKCGATSAFIPVPGVLSLEITDMIEGKSLVGDFALAIDEETMLCRVGEDYYYVKADSEAEALALLNAELAVVKPEVQTE